MPPIIKTEEETLNGVTVIKKNKIILLIYSIRSDLK